MENAVEMRDIVKTFGAVLANNGVCLDIRKGEILSLLGENGSGKTTLMNMLSGIYFPDSGRIIVDNQEVAIRSPKDAYDLKIGMVHQHFKLVDVFTASENIVLGMEGSTVLDRKSVDKKVADICAKYGFEVDPNKKIYNMSVSEKQTVEIVKVLYRGADILILDEPTAVLTPQETERLFAILRNMKRDGKAVVIITHKLHEVMELSDRVAVLRKGENAGEVETKKADIPTLTEMMVGRAISLDIERPTPENLKKRLEIKNLTCLSPDGVKALSDISLTVYGGEILGVAGVSGSGQKELLEAVAGLQNAEAGGSVLYYPGEEDSAEELLGKTPLQIKNMGVALSFVPEDRLGMGLVGSMDMTDNMMLRSYREGHSAFADRKNPKRLAEDVIKRLEVVTPGVTTPVRRLSGGNVQKVLVGREIASEPRVLMTAYAVRGLDINTSYTIYHLLNEQKKKGVAVIYVGEDLDVLLELCDRIAVLCAGRLNAVLDARETTKEEVGRVMTYIGEGGGKA